MKRYKASNPEDLAVEIARHKVRKISDFFTHLFIFVVAVVIYIAKTYYGAPLNFWPIRFVNFTFMVVWILIIAVQGLQLFFSEMVFGTHWEKRKMQQFIAKNKQNKWE